MHNMSDPHPFLLQLGLSEKEADIYLALLSMGPSSVRTIAERTGINRGTTHDTLKMLRQRGLATYFHKRTRQFFVAKKPETLVDVIRDQQHTLTELERDAASIIPELKVRERQALSKPTVTFYEGSREIASVLKDVLASLEAAHERSYAVYSAADIRTHLYTHFSSFTAVRKKKNIRVRVIALGEGGTVTPPDERRWLTRKTGGATYTIIYANKVAFISVNASGAPIGVIVEEKATASTQRIIFDSLWGTLA